MSYQYIISYPEGGTEDGCHCFIDNEALASEYKMRLLNGESIIIPEKFKVQIVPLVRGVDDVH